MSRRFQQIASEEGYTMAAIMLVLLATSILAGASFAAVGADIPFTREAQDRKQAYAAAEAGVEYYLYQLTRDNDFWKNCADVPPSASGEVSPVNLLNPSPRRWRKLSGAAADGRFSIELLPANGAANCAKSTTAKPTQSEDTMIDQATGTFRIRSTGESRGVRRSLIATFRRNGFLDYLYFTDYEASDPNSFASASSRDYAAANCVKYRVQREANSWCRDNATITFPKWDVINGPLHTNDDLLTCGSPKFGRVGKKDRIQIVGPASDGWTGSGDDGCSGSPAFNGPVIHPAKYLTMPASNSRLKDAALDGYVYEGETTITFNGTTTMTVENQGSTYQQSLPPNGVIYVDKLGTCALDYPRETTYTSSPGCAVLTVRGTYPKSMTLGARDDILINGDLRRSGDVVLGLIAQRFVRVYHPASRQSDGDCNGNGSGYINNITIEAAILALNDSFIVDNYNCGLLGTLTVNGAIAQKFRGPVGTFNSDSGNKSTGYTKNYNYDDRLRYRNPPYFLDPVSAAWRVMRQSEQVPAAKQ